MGFELLGERGVGTFHASRCIWRLCNYKVLISRPLKCGTANHSALASFLRVLNAKRSTISRNWRYQNRERRILRTRLQVITRSIVCRRAIVRATGGEAYPTEDCDRRHNFNWCTAFIRAYQPSISRQISSNEHEPYRIHRSPRIRKVNDPDSSH